jgi:hypothetical protein
MITPTGQDVVTIGRLRSSGIVMMALAVTALGFNACGIISKVKSTVHDIRGNKATIDSFNTKLQSGASTTFEATYITTGSAPATIVYAVQPPKGVAFNLTPTGGSGDTTPVHLVANSSGEYACSQASSAQWTCQKLGPTDAATRNEIFSFYTPAHWIGFLRDFSLNCVDFNATGVPGTSTICSTAQGILGYVKVASDSTSFQIQSYSTSPAASLFELPPGAKVTTGAQGAPS